MESTHPFTILIKLLTWNFCIYLFYLRSQFQTPDTNNVYFACSHLFGRTTKWELKIDERSVLEMNQVRTNRREKEHRTMKKTILAPFLSTTNADS